jgi:hypothetical protein
MVDLMHVTSVEIYTAKKKALEEGEEALTQQVGQGRDIISILSKSDSYSRLIENSSDLGSSCSEGEHEGSR